MQIAQALDGVATYEGHPRLKLFKIQRTCVHDGPGIRTTLFFQGCSLRCVWCQNPESQPLSSEIVPDCNYSIDQIIEMVSRDKQYYSATDGGVTLSGGEPFLQDSAGLSELLLRLKNEKVYISVETTLHAPWKTISELAPYIDLFLVDLKVVGDEILHKKLTQQGSALIHENLKKLLDSGARVKFRMVIVPGLNDSQQNIQAAARFLGAIGYSTIELLQYHNLYESKAKQLGLNIDSLNISPEASIASLKRGVELFTQYGIFPEYIDPEYSRHPAEFTQRVRNIQQAIRESPRAICIESAKLKTWYYSKMHGFKKPLHIHRGEKIAFLLKHKKITVYPDELLVGNFTAKRVAGHVWEELYGALPWVVFLYKINRQKPIPYKMSFKDRLYFYFRIIPYWWRHSIMMYMYPLFSKKQIQGMARTAEMVAGFNNNMVMIAHYIENFDRILKLGTIGLIEEVKATMAAHPENNQDFYKGVLIALEGLEAFGLRYAEELVNLSDNEADPIRKRELEEMAAVCAHVPKYPARTYHEALQSMLFLHIALCNESYENAISFGRLDQILYPYYKKDLKEGRITYEKAKELLCLFILKQDEVFFVNDGNSILRFYKNFESITTDQTITFGGVDKDGNDATNDITYMLIDACELQPLCVDPSARIHEKSPQKYIERLAEVYINGCPMPKLNSDKVYIETILRHYSTTLENARNYSIVGCVEPCVSEDHFGNTDCANVNLALPFIQAMKGHEYDLWHFGFGDQIFKFNTNTLEWIFGFENKLCNAVLRRRYRSMKKREKKKGLYTYNPPSSMEELLERFQARLNHITNQILADHQEIEKILREHFTTPLGSSLSKGCLIRGKDLYEGGANFNSSGIQAVGVTDVADSICALDEVVFKKQIYSFHEVLTAMDADFEGEFNQQIRAALLSAPKFGDDYSPEPPKWVNVVMQIYNNALDSVPNCPRNGRYSAGYYALNVSNRYGRKTPALPSGRLYGVPLANSIIPHYGMEQADLLSSLNAIAGVDFVEHAENGATLTFTIDPALFQGKEGVQNLSAIFKTFLLSGGIQMQPNVVNREILLDAYKNPDKHKYLMVRIAGYCAYFNELSDEMKLSIINRTYYS
jgi:formate C-acetyltransferase